MSQPKNSKENDLPRWVKFVSSLLEQGRSREPLQAEKYEDKPGDLEYDQE